MQTCCAETVLEFDSWQFYTLFRLGMSAEEDRLRRENAELRAALAALSPPPPAPALPPQLSPLPWASSAGLSGASLSRFARHVSLPPFGAAAQARLAGSTVLLVGAGGLGSPAALYLAAAGVGTLRIADGDAVELSNLQRQVVHTEVRSEPSLTAQL